MAYTQADIDALKQAIATGALKVRYADGREATYRSLTDLKRILADMETEATGATPIRTSYVAHCRD